VVCGRHVLHHVDKQRHRHALLITSVKLVSRLKKGMLHLVKVKSVQVCFLPFGPLGVNGHLAVCRVEQVRRPGQDLVKISMVIVWHAQHLQKRTKYLAQKRAVIHV